MMHGEELQPFKYQGHSKRHNESENTGSSTSLMHLISCIYIYEVLCVE